MTDLSNAAAALGRKGGTIGGRSTSEAKKAAVRENGKKGGRPRHTLRVQNVYTREEQMVCNRHLDANTVGSAVHELLGDVQALGPGVAGECVACQKGLPE